MRPNSTGMGRIMAAAMEKRKKTILYRAGSFAISVRI
jgi:hypothetical protein